MSGDTRRRGSRVSEQRALPPRRLLLIGGGAAVLAVLVDRGLRLDLPQPPPPVPTRRPAADEALLVAVVRDLDEVLRTWPRATRPTALKGIRGLVQQQRRVLAGRLTNDGVPTDEITAPPTTPPTTPTTPTTPTPPTTSADAAPVQHLTVARLAQLLAILPAGHLKATTSATDGARELLTAAYGGLLTGAGLLGEDVLPASGTSPVRSQLAERTSPLVYAFEVVAAQSSGGQRRRALTALERLRALERAVGRAEESSGWPLPFAVTDDKSADRLADLVLGRAIGALGAVLPAVPTPEAVDDVARWLAVVQLAAVDWGRNPVALPGLRQPRP
ncbi:DUF4439 domain-containing protein [Intrasporangium calvum]|uniref:DUF4439 domain-containing protein n=1 Tax=Intrasporangium calvum (strain ATCC 23552 / DSM 43043 / JCM 3097 / NBRC 12989 / NCIMB 10167 / NRRL B-3866 / 7 KIP) TaxID=710696 RepID=E6SE90_INTC7|nr:DUF4439 domain-containing protein [Intrasporangium calvum]ADU48738.1 hypothetical protein Intca_2229 [Intrasporangium calvum DSM 43043]